MIILQSKSGLIPFKIIYFAQKPSLRNSIFGTYRSTQSNKHFFLFKRETINTLVNSLKQSESELLRSFKKPTVYEINRSIRDRATEFDLQASMADFMNIYNNYADTKGWRHYKLRKELKNNLHATVCRLNGKIIIGHLYFLDPNSKRVCLEASVSDICRTKNIQLRALIGRANRHLHYADMLYFKNLGFEQYDFGGYDDHNIDDPKKIGINRFKNSFNGKLVYESNYTSYPLMALFTTKKIYRHFTKKFKQKDSNRLFFHKVNALIQLIHVFRYHSPL